MAGLLDFLQSASNTAASNVSAPVDGIAWLLRKAGLNIGEPVGGSDWMQRQGLTSPVEQSGASLAGETMGLLAPIGVAAKAPQIARGLLKMGENAAIPQTLGKQAGVILYHGSNSKKPINAINDSGVFGGLFASPSKVSANSHGESMYRMTVPDESILKIGDDLPWDSLRSSVEKRLANTPHLDDLADMVGSGKSVWESSIPEDDLLSALRSSDLGAADWELQRIRGQVAKDHGFRAVEMPDEHGMSYLVLPGTKPRPLR